MGFEVCILLATASNAVFLYLMSRQFNELDKRNDLEHRDMSYEMKDKINGLGQSIFNLKHDVVEERYENSITRRKVDELPLCLWAKGESKC